MKEKILSVWKCKESKRLGIQHIKKLSKEINPPNTPSTPLRLKNEGIIDWILENFNITEKDLK